MKWSERFTEELALNLTPDLVDWLDSDIRERNGWDYAGYFDVANAPESLLDPTSAVVWGGQMLPDTLPVLGNGCGDQLALRVDSNGHVAEVIQWQHESGTWRPFGATIPEAILADIASLEAAGHTDLWEPGAYARERWAVDWVRRTTGPTLEWPVPQTPEPRNGLERLRRAQVCELVTLAESCTAFLQSPLEKRVLEIGGEVVADKLGLAWGVVSSWLFDHYVVPDEFWATLERVLGVPGDELRYQDWDQALAVARRASELRPDLAWPYVIVGYAAQRQGDVQGAIATYHAGLRSLGTSYEYVAGLGEHELRDRLEALREHLPPEVVSDPYFQAATTPLRGLEEDPLRAFWMTLAQEAEAGGDHARAYQHYYHAGWDRYFCDDMEKVLEGLVRTAAAAGHTARHRVANLHLASLRAQ